MKKIEVCNDQDLSKAVKQWMYDSINCYQFSIGILNQEFSRNLMPGDLSGKEVPVGYKFTDKELVELVLKDLKSIGYKGIFSTKEPLAQKEGFVIAVLNCKDDFHFLRKIDGRWYQKFVESQFASYHDRLDNPILDPSKAAYWYHYHLVGYIKATKAGGG